MNRLISTIRIFYTVTLLLLALGGAVFYMIERAAAQHGSIGNFQSQNHIIFLAFFFLLLASRLLYYRSSQWLWLGTPTILAILGFVGYILYLPSL
jgi:hypothetical protein